MYEALTDEARNIYQQFLRLNRLRKSIADEAAAPPRVHFAALIPPIK